MLNFLSPAPIKHADFRKTFAIPNFMGIGQVEDALTKSNNVQAFSSSYSGYSESCRVVLDNELDGIFS
jgi:hypothetical protein